MPRVTASSARVAVAATVAAALALPIGVAAAAEGGSRPRRDARRSTTVEPARAGDEAAGPKRKTERARTKPRRRSEAGRRRDGSTGSATAGRRHRKLAARPGSGPASQAAAGQRRDHGRRSPPGRRRTRRRRIRTGSRRSGRTDRRRSGRQSGAGAADPALTASACAATAVPPQLIPIYQRASAQYGLGSQGPAVLAGINAVETAFGTNLGPSSAGAEGWMQFMPSTWAEWGVDANGDGVADPNNPEDAIFSAARYLSAAGMPADTYGAIYAYNHADWYVSEVLADAGCYAAEVGDTSFTAAGLTPQIEVLQLRSGAGLEEADPGRIPGSLRGRRRPLRTRQTRRLGARRDRPPRVQLRQRDVEEAARSDRPARPRSERVEAVPRRRRRRRPHPTRRHLRLRPHPRPRDLVEGLARSRRLRPQPGRLVRRRGDRRGRRNRRRLQDLLRRLARRPARRRNDRRRRRSGDPAERPRRRAGERAARGQGRDRRRQLDRHHPLRLGRRPRQLLLLRLRLLGRGQLRPLRRRPARLAAHLRLAGELRRTRSRQVDHDLRQRDPHLHGDRRAALGHGRRRQRHRPPLARRTAVSGRASWSGTPPGTRPSPTPGAVRYFPLIRGRTERGTRICEEES